MIHQLTKSRDGRLAAQTKQARNSDAVRGCGDSDLSRLAVKLGALQPDSDLNQTGLILNGDETNIPHKHRTKRHEAFRRCGAHTLHNDIMYQSLG